MQWIEQFVFCVREFNPVSILTRIILAVILGSMIGLEREKTGRAAGLRTHILVCLGATIASMTGIYLTKEFGGEDVSRIAAQVVSGIGFLGAGTILVKNKSIVTGLTTAAGVWTVGTIGIALGYGFYEAAIVGAIFAAIVTGVLGSVDRKLFSKSKVLNLYAEFKDAEKLNNTLNEMKEKDYQIVSFHLTNPKGNYPKGVGADIAIISKKKNHSDKIIEEINSLDNVAFAITLI